MKLYNTLTKKIEDFIPNKEGYVKMYNINIFYKCIAVILII